MARSYPIDTAVRLTGTFSLVGTCEPGDPTDVKLYLGNPEGVVQILNYPADNIVRQSVGVYTYEFSPTLSGEWAYKWQGTGAIIATSPDQVFHVKPSNLIPG